MLVYIWSKRNPYIRMNFFGMLNFNAPYLPWVLFGFSLLLDNSVMIDLMGIAVGHIYFYLEDVFPNINGGFRVLKTPRLLRLLFDEAEDDYGTVPEETRAGGYNWGEQPGEQAAENNVEHEHDE